MGAGPGTFGPRAGRRAADDTPGPCPVHRLPGHPHRARRRPAAAPRPQCRPDRQERQPLGHSGPAQHGGAIDPSSGESRPGRARRSCDVQIDDCAIAPATVRLASAHADTPVIHLSSPRRSTPMPRSRPRSGTCSRHSPRAGRPTGWWARSPAASSRSPRACSGDRYCAVPITRLAQPDRPDHPRHGTVLTPAPPPIPRAAGHSGRGRSSARCRRRPGRLARASHLHNQRR